MPDKQVDQDVTSEDDRNISPKRKISENDQLSKKRKLDTTECGTNNEIKESFPSEPNELVSKDCEDINCETQNMPKPTNRRILNLSTTDGYKECRPCEKTFNSPLTYNQHLMSSGHSKVISRAIKTTWECEICNKTFSGPIPYDQHLSSKLHSKTIKTIELTGKFKEKKCLDASIEECKDSKSNDNNGPVVVKELACEICDKKFTGPIPYDMHLTSKIHSKNVMRMVLTSKEIKEKIENSTNDDTVKEKEPQFVALKEVHQSLQKSARIENSTNDDTVKDKEPQFVALKEVHQSLQKSAGNENTVKSEEPQLGE